MNKLIPFKKQIKFKTPIFEIVSISLEHNLEVVSDGIIHGDFIVSGEYRLSDSSTNTDPFEFQLPCDIEVQKHYDMDKAQINIDDFYYEVIDSDILEVNIVVLLDKLEEKTEEITNEIVMPKVDLDEYNSDINEMVEDRNNNDIEEEELMNVEEEKENVSDCTQKRCVETEEYTKSLFSNFDETEDYKTYKVYIVREGDNLEHILSKYQISKEELEKYNNLTELNIGDKIIIPY